MIVIARLSLLCAVIGFVFSQNNGHAVVEEGEVPEFDSYSDYLDCVDQGACPVDVEVTSVSPEYLATVPTVTEHDTVHPAPSYGDLCLKMSSKMFELESTYPELNAKKVEMLKKLILYTSSFESTCSKGESIINKILDFVILVAHQLKAHLASYKPAPTIPPVQIIEPDTEPEEIIAEEEYGFVGSIRGIPGVHYPNYTEIPITSFSCSDKHVPGFYADLETGCQVFHVCYEHRRESFLCPLGTTFNQPILACDYWYSSNCSEASIYYEVNEQTVEITDDEEEIQEIITTVIEKKPVELPPKDDLKQLVQFLPVKAKVIEIPSKKVVGKAIAGAKLLHAVKMTSAILSTAAKVKMADKIKGKIEKAALVKTKAQIASAVPLKIKAVAIPIAKTKIAGVAATGAKVKMAAAIPAAKLKAASIPITKAKIAGVAAKTKLASSIPIAKLKVASVPVAKTKLAGVAAVGAKAKLASAIPIAGVAAKAKLKVASVPVTKTKLAGVVAFGAKAKLASAIPIAGLKVIPAAKLFPLPLAKAAVPVFKAKAIPLVKMAAVKPKLIPGFAAASIPLVKVKAASVLSISPLTKKALALGYKKLLMTKKFALMG